MTEAQLKAAVLELAPSFAKEAPGPVLIKYARSHNLAPAELERLAQFTNVCMAVSHTKKAAPEDRGQEIQIVQIPQLLAEYTDTSKEASRPEPVRRSSWTCDTTASFTVGQHFAPAVPETQKAASTTELVKEARGSEEAYQELHREHTMMQRLDNDLRQELRQHHTKLAVHIHSHRHQVPKLLADVRLHSKCAAEVAFLSFLRHDVGHHVPDEQVKQASDVTFSHDSFKIASTVAAMDHIHQQRQALREVEKDLMAAVQQECPKYASAFASLDPKKYPAPADEAGAKPEPEQGPPPAPSPEEIMNGHRQDLMMELGQVDQMRNLYQLLGLPEQGPPAARGKGEGKGEGKGQPGNAKEAPAAPAHGADAGIGAAAAGAGMLASTAGSGIEATRRSLQSILDLDMGAAARRTSEGYRDLADPNPEGRMTSLQGKMQRYQHAITLSRLINTDAVLRKADPAQVAAIYQSIAKLNPEIAADIHAVKPILREALQYQGLPLNSMKTLRDLQSGNRQPARR